MPVSPIVTQPSSRVARTVESIVTHIGYPFLLISTIGVHGYTTWTAYHLASGSGRYFAAAAAFVFFPVSEAVVAYYAWRASGSMINGYSIWLLLWLMLLVGVGSLILVSRRLDRRARRKR